MFLLDFLLSYFLSSIFIFLKRGICAPGKAVIVQLWGCTLHCCVMDLQHWCHCCETEMRSDLLELWMCVYAGSVWIYFVKFSWDVTMTDGARDAARLLLVASFLDCNEISRRLFILCWSVCVLTCQCALTLNYLACTVESWGFGIGLKNSNLWSSVCLCSSPLQRAAQTLKSK